MQEVTICFLRRGTRDADEVCLGWKKAGFGAAKWAGIGGKVNAAAQETAAQAARRELAEEIRVEAVDLPKVAELTFLFPHRPARNMQAHVYIVAKWHGVPTETVEMRPRWFAIGALPLDQMWDDAKHWLPRILKGEQLRAWFSFDQHDCVDQVAITVLQPGE